MMENKITTQTMCDEGKSATMTMASPTKRTTALLIMHLDGSVSVEIARDNRKVLSGCLALAEVHNAQ
jgi:hypothetical protein